MQFSAASPAVRLVGFDDCRHFVMDDRPAELDAAIAEFLSGNDPVKPKGS
jgi:pimeloyl-ACP methyl ester carboxylesterase